MRLLSCKEFYLILRKREKRICPSVCIMFLILLYKSMFIFLNYILLIMLLQLSQFFLLGPSPPSNPHTLRQSPHHCSCPWVMSVSCLATPFPTLYIPVYFTSPWLLCNYLFVLLNSLFTQSPTTSSHLATIKMLSISMILSLFFLFP